MVLSRKSKRAILVLATMIALIFGSAQKSATLTVEAGSLSSLRITLSPSTVTAGGSITATATGYDSQGNDLGPEAVTWSTPTAAEGGWNGDVYTSRIAGSWIVTGTYSVSITGTALLTVNPGLMRYVTISPATATIKSGTQQAYKCTAYDAFGNSLGDVTASAIWSISAGAGGSWGQYVYTSLNPGHWTVKATYNGLTATATLAVTGAPSTTPSPPPTAKPTPTPCPANTPTAVPTATPTSTPLPTLPLYIPPSPTPIPTVNATAPTLNPVDQMLSTAFSKPALLVLICVFVVAFLGALAIVSRVRRTRKLKM